MISAFGVDSSASVPLQLNFKQLRLDSPSGFGDKNVIKRLEKSFFCIVNAIHILKLERYRED